ncbi:O-antigen ligase family protein [Bradyrhizobium yuanmingense]|uniref:O-antigen ligase family protein n=1 Tax=Bradyrhizobium yuanmingense TaxID=108015 RepID=UPI001CD3EE4E|nr:O-antigen ligase family protein [Bradyrhizobium yuanmingense]MCA1527373.1 O-antigen ligase family protein [Bradyrhizobium yuanmingense]
MLNDINGLRSKNLGIGALFLLGFACAAAPSVAEIITAALVMVAIVVLARDRTSLYEPPIILGLVWMGFVLLSATYAAANGLPGDHFKALGKHLPIALGPIVAVPLASLRLRQDTVLVVFLGGLAIGAAVLLVRNGAISLIAGELVEPDRAYLGRINRNSAGLACGLLIISAASLLQYVVLQKPWRLLFSASFAVALGAAIVFAEILLISLQSRTALIATGIAMATWFGAQLKYGFGRDSTGRLYRYAAVALLATVVIVSATKWSTMTQRFDNLTAAIGAGRPPGDLVASGQDRLALTALAIDLIKQRPLLGWGPDVSRLPYLFAQTNGVKSLTQFHNGYLQILVNFGAIGALLMISLIVVVLRAAARSPGSMSAASFSGALAIAAYITVSNFTESMLFVKPAGASAMMLIALVCMPALGRRLPQRPSAI